MKKLSQISILAFLLFGISLGSLLIDEETPAITSRYLAGLETELQGVVDKAYQDGGFKTAKPKIVTPCTDSKPQDNKLEICYISDGKDTVNIKMKNAVQTTELEYSNLDLKDPKSEININKYIESFLKQNEEIAVDEVTKKNAIQAGVEDALKIVKATDVAISLEAKACSIAYTLAGKKCVITCEINGNTIKFETGFFSDVLDLSIPLIAFIKFEVSKVVKEMVKHLQAMQKFALSDGAEAAQSLKETTCDQILKSDEVTKDFQERLKTNGLALESAENQLTLKGGDKSVVIKCSSNTVSGSKIISLDALFDGIDKNLQPVNQVLLASSLYNMKSIGIAFIEDTGTLTIRMISPNNAEEKFQDTQTSDVVRGNSGPGEVTKGEEGQEKGIVGDETEVKKLEDEGQPGVEIEEQNKGQGDIVQTEEKEPPKNEEEEAQQRVKVQRNLSNDNRKVKITKM